MCVSERFHCIYTHETLQDGRTPLIWASLRGHVAIVRLLLERRAGVHIHDKVSFHNQDVGRD